MFDLLSGAAPVIGWFVIIVALVVLALITAFVSWLVLDFAGRCVACNAFAHKARWHKPEETRWQRAQRAASIAWYTLWNPKKSFHSRNNYMIELIYHHPLRWRLINHWDLIPDDEEEDSEGD